MTERPNADHERMVHALIDAGVLRMVGTLPAADGDRTTDPYWLGPLPHGKALWVLVDQIDGETPPKPRQNDGSGRCSAHGSLWCPECEGATDE